MSSFGDEQIAWLKNDLKGVSHSTPIVIMAHIPMWTVYEQWGWGTADADAALALLKPYGSVTVLNGHIHQVLQKVEGNVALHTAMSLAYPLPTPGQEGFGEPGPVTVPAGNWASCSARGRCRSCAASTRSRRSTRRSKAEVSGMERK